MEEGEMTEEPQGFFEEVRFEQGLEAQRQLWSPWFQVQVERLF